MTRTPCSSATRLRLKSLVRMTRLRARASATSLASTSADLGHVVLDDLDRRSAGSFCIRFRISRPRRPRLRRSASELSAMCWSSSSTKRGTTSVP